MKKIIMIITLLLIYPINGLCISTDWSTTEDTNKIKILEEKRYRWYQEKKIGEYLLPGNNDYQYVDKTNQKYEYTNWSLNCSEQNQDLENATIYRYRNLVYIKYIMIKNINSPIYLNYISVYGDGNILEYQIYKMENVIKSDKYLINNNGYIILVLARKVNIDDLQIKLNATENNKYLNISLYKSNNFNISNGDYRICTNTKYLTTTSWLNENSYTDYMYSDIIPKYKQIILPKESINLCRYKKTLYYYYNIERNYYDNNYYSYVEGYLKDQKDYKTYYLYMDNTNQQIIYKNANVVQSEEKSNQQCNTNNNNITESASDYKNSNISIIKNNQEYQQLLKKYNTSIKKMNNTKYLFVIVLFGFFLYFLIKVVKKIVG